MENKNEKKRTKRMSKKIKNKCQNLQSEIIATKKEIMLCYDLFSQKYEKFHKLVAELYSYAGADFAEVSEIIENMMKDKSMEDIMEKFGKAKK